jgi:hypothetical protein
MQMEVATGRSQTKGKPVQVGLLTTRKLDTIVEEAPPSKLIAYRAPLS